MEYFAVENQLFWGIGPTTCRVDRGSADGLKLVSSGRQAMQGSSICCDTGGFFTEYGCA
jgi:hypothetical protein